MMEELTNKDLHCIATTLQGRKFKLDDEERGDVDGSGQVCKWCKYSRECFMLKKDGSIEKYRHGLNEALRKLQTVTGVYLGY